MGYLLFVTNSNAKELADHVKDLGHPVAKEKIHSIELDITEMKNMLNENTKLLHSIDKKLPD